MKIIEILENRKEALRVSEVAKILGVSPQQVYKMVADGQIPHFHVAWRNQILSLRTRRVDQERNSRIDSATKFQQRQELD